MVIQVFLSRTCKFLFNQFIFNLYIAVEIAIEVIQSMIVQQSHPLDVQLKPSHAA